MLNYYQLHWWRFFTTRSHPVAPGVWQQSFVSFEDGLWELLPKMGLVAGSVVLVPDFYCVDVIQNIEAHGYVVQLYSLDQHLQPLVSDFWRQVRRLKPSLVVFFHASGISCALATADNISRLSEQGIWVLEDSVHRLINPSQVRLQAARHVIMDSLRKVSPLPGSLCYVLNTLQQQWQQSRWNHPTAALGWQQRWFEWVYPALAGWLYGWFWLTQSMGVLFQQPQLVKLAHEKILKIHDDLIGDSRSGHVGWWGLPFVVAHFNFAALEKVKNQQVKLYQQALTQIWYQQSRWYQINISPSDYPQLHAYPLGISQPLTLKQVAWLHQQGAIIWPKFPDCVWASRQGVLFLPLGFQVSDQEIRQLVKLLAQLPDC